MRRTYKKLALMLALNVAGALIAIIIAARLMPLPERLQVPGSRVVEYADGTPMCVYLSPDDKWRIHVALDEVDPDYIEALLKFEDGRFYVHPGVDPVAIGRAALQNLAARRVVSGASTITMQLARIVEPRPRNLRSKVIEAFRAMQLEMRYSKNEILELYLAFAPYGKNIEGIEAASLAYFGHRAKHLSPFETAYLLSVPQNPSFRYPSARHARHMDKVVGHVTRTLVNAGAFDKQEEAAALRGLMPTSLRPFPREAMHVAFYLSDKHEGMRVPGAIKRDAQSVVESVIANYRAELESMGIHNASALVIDNESGAVVAAAGNLDFWDHDHHGQVIGFKAPRSPGSAMKPFIYAMAIDRGLALPGYLVADIPVYYTGYQPINYDREFRGLVRLEDALSQSLNIPFVNLLREIGLNDYQNFLREGGITTLKDEPGYYGLSIAIGSLEVKLEELVALYAMIARDGEFIEPLWTTDREPRPAERLLSTGAAYLTRRTLQKRDRPDFPERHRAMQFKSTVFWKTGTSAYHRDAWAVGGNKRYTAGVWVGNFDGTSSRYLVGSNRAGPVLFDILEGLPETAGENASAGIPEELIKVDVCSWSGHLAGKHCTHIEKALAPRSSVPRLTCPYHVEYLVDRETGRRVNPLCAAGKEVQPKVFTVLPAAARRWISDLKLEAPAPPPLLKTCKRVAANNGPQIVRPRPNAVFFIVPGLKADRQEIMFEADAGADVGELYWFVDGKFTAAKAPDQRVWLKPTPGKHEVRVVDAYGKSDAVSINILSPG
jgi:penicillin-binding protein 1C